MVFKWSPNNCYGIWQSTVMVVMFFATCYCQHEQENVYPAAHFVAKNLAVFFASHKQEISH